MTQITATFGRTLFPAEARTYTVQQLPHIPASAWRRETLAYLHQVVGALGGDDFRSVLVGLGLGEKVKAMQRGTWKVETVFSTANALMGLVGVAFTIHDWMWDRLCAYSPVIASDAQWIGDHATDAEIVDVFVAVLLQLALDADETRALAKIANTIEAKRVPGVIRLADRLRKSM